MKQILMTLCISVSFILVKGQVNDYFIPSNDYLNETFLFETGKWENENGQFQTKNKVLYFIDLSGNFKKYIESTSYRYNVPDLTMKVHQFYSVSESKVIDIYFYVEGISDELKERGFIDDNDNNKIILKYPKANWSDKTDPDVTEYYRSEFGDIETYYGKYPNCIIVTKSAKSITGKEKWTEKFVEKSYYAKNLGLIKTETYENGKLMKMEFGYGGTLVDNFSIYSFYQQNKERNEKLEKEKAKSIEDNKLKSFLEERSNTIYDYKTINTDKSLEFEKDIKYNIQNIIDQYSLKNYYFNIETEYFIDTLKKQSNKILITGIDNLQIENRINQYLKNTKLSTATVNNYSVNAKAKWSFSFSQTSQEFCLKKNKDGLFLVIGNATFFEQNISYLNSQILYLPDGNYRIALNCIQVDDLNNNSVDYLSYKSYGGGSAFFLSLIIPGTGDYIVNGGKGSMLGNLHPLVTTIGVYSFIGTGLFFKSLSVKNYEWYHSSTVQADINKYYDLANSQNKTAWTLIGFGGAIWLADILWVAKTGVKNKKTEKETKNKLNIAFTPSFDSSSTLSLTYKF